MNKTRCLSLLLLSSILISGCAISPTHPSLADKLTTEVIPVRDFVANRDIKYSYKISPDGQRLAWLEVKGFNPTLFYKTIGEDKVNSLDQPLYGFTWAKDSKRIHYSSHEGDENTHIYSIDLENPDNSPADLTPYPDTKVSVYHMFDTDPDRLLIKHNQRDKHFFDLYLLDIKTAKQTLIAKASDDIHRWIIDPEDTDGKVIGTVNKTKNGYNIVIKASSDNSYDLSYSYGSEDIFKIVSYEKEKHKLWVLTDKGRERVALITIDLSTMQEKTVYESKQVDISQVFINPKTRKPVYVILNPDYPEVVILDESFKNDLALFNTSSHSSFQISSFDRNLQRFTLIKNTDKGYEYFYYDRKNNSMTSLAKSPVAKYAPIFASQNPIRYTSRDGLEINGYLSLPTGISPEKLPLLVYVHGGPHSRDIWGYNSLVQFLANRGYAVLQINYRGSTGYGRSFKQAAYGEFAGKMHTDILDGVDWAIDQGIADPDKVAIFGESYGGYEALVGLTFSPDKFSCAISVAGMSDLTSLIVDAPKYWQKNLEIWDKFIGKADNPDDLKSMHEKSPLFFTDRVKKPLLIIHGARDVRVKMDQTIRFADSLKSQNKKVDLWIAKNEGHGISRWNNRLTYFRKTEDFLAQCLGGRSGGYDYYQLVNIFSP